LKYQLIKNIIITGGKEATRTNMALISILHEAMTEAGYPTDSVQYISSREMVAELLKCDSLIDLVIPRGSRDLVTSIQSSTRYDFFILVTYTLIEHYLNLKSNEIYPEYGKFEIEIQTHYCVNF
jgi:gamma-glutamyl phosphate reductase